MREGELPAFCTLAEGSDASLRLACAERQDMVRMLSDEGMSTRAIAPIIGVHNDTVAADRKSGVGIPTPEPAPENVETATGEITDEPVDYAKETSRIIDEAKEGRVSNATPTPVTELDGVVVVRATPWASG